MRLRRKLLGGVVLLVAAQADAQQLAGWARLEADTFVAGPTSGQFLVTPAFPDSQPVQGVSSVISLDDGRLLALVDNGFGRKENSADFLLRTYFVELDFESHRAELSPAFVFNDLNRRLAWPIVADGSHYPDSTLEVPAAMTEHRWLTGHDLDPESIEVQGRNRFWVGDEFGPFLLEFDARGVLQAPPIEVPGLISPDHPTKAESASINRSSGIEAMAIDEHRLLVLLEKPTADRLLPLYRFDTRTRAWMESSPFRYYPLPEGANAVGAMAAQGSGRLLLIERDSAAGEQASHKRLMMIDVNHHQDGILRPIPVLDLLAIPDPDEHHPGAGPYSMPFWTIESIAVIDHQHVLIANDNNFPFGTGRSGEIGSEATEFALIRLPASSLNRGMKLPGIRK